MRAGAPAAQPRTARQPHITTRRTHHEPHSDEDALTANFTSVFSNNATNYTVAGFVPVDTIQWFLNDNNDVFYDNVDSFGDAAGGTLMAPANWSNPQSFTGACDAAAAVGNRPVPTLSQWGMIILSSLLALGSIVMLRRRGG